MRRTAGKRDLHRALVTRILDGDGTAAPAARKAAFENAGPQGPVATLIDKAATSATTVTDADFAAAKGTGMSEDQIFELVYCAVIGQASRLYERGRAALAEASGEPDGDHEA